jgi:hypothetical protein
MRMREQSEGGGELKRYLLGELTQEERALVEERLFLDREYLRQLQSVEDELIDDYVYDDLPASDRGKFETHFLSQAERDGDLRFARALRRYVAADAGAGEASPVAAPGPRTADEAAPLAFLFKSHPVVRYSLAIAALIILSVCVWLAIEAVRQRRPAQPQAQGPEPQRAEPGQQGDEKASGNVEASGNNQGVEPGERDGNASREDKQGKGQTAQQSPSPRHASPTPSRPQGQTVAVLLVPGDSVRGEEETNTISLSPDAGSVILQLPLVENENYRRYRATLESGDRTLRTWVGLKPVTAEAGRVVQIRVPSALLRQENYKVRLGASTADGRLQEFASFSFRIKKR